MMKQIRKPPRRPASIGGRILGPGLLLALLVAGAGCGSLRTLAGDGRQLALPVRTDSAQEPGHALPVPLLYAEAATCPQTAGVSLELRQAYRRHWQNRLRQLKLRPAPVDRPDQVAAAAAASVAGLQEEDYQAGAVLLYQALALSGLTAAERDELEYLAVLHRQAHLLFRALVAVQRLKERNVGAENAARQVRDYLQLQQRHDGYLRWHDPFWRDYLRQAVAPAPNLGAGGQ